MPELAKGAIEPEEGFLVDVTRLVLRSDRAERHAQDAPVMAADQLLERRPVAALGLADQPRFVAGLHSLTLRVGPKAALTRRWTDGEGKGEQVAAKKSPQSNPG